MADWATFAHSAEYPFDAASVRKNWVRLHAGDAEPLPDSTAVLEAWALFHAGAFHAAMQAGLKVGGNGHAVANKAACIHANYLEPRETARHRIFLEVVERAGEQAVRDPADASAWYWQAYALGRYSQGISVAKALAQGLSRKVKHALEKTIALRPRHADAHVALAAFHAEVIDKVGTLIGAMTYGARKDTSLTLFRHALQIHPGSAIAMIEYANGLAMLEGEGKAQEATALYEQAAAIRPIDAMERLDVELARSELEN